MSLLDDALRAAHPAVGRRSTGRSAIVVGGGGPLGSAVLERALASGLFWPVRVVVDAPIAPGLRGLQPMPRTGLDGSAAHGADTAFIVFDRARQAHGREAAFHRPDPASLGALSTALRRGGVLQLVVVLPHAPSLLPHALREGLATLDEHAVATLDFEQIVFVRPAQKGAGGRGDHARWLDRVAAGVLAQLHWMVPAREQPLRAAQVAAFSLELAAQLPQARVGTRVASAELLWAFAQPDGGPAVIAAWLAGQARQPPAVPSPRL